ncbi:MAG: hypothetical protein K6U74_17270 [Firmicutes bacterium]|nr:hypothetical protein [Bacillota bacterium]
MGAVDLRERKKNILSERGQALVLVMLSLLVLALVGAASLTLTGTHGKEARYQKDLMQAYYTAEAGLERALVKIRANPELGNQSGVLFSQVPYAGGGTFDVSLSPESQNGFARRVKITSDGRFGTAKKTLEISLLVLSVSDLLKGTSILSSDPVDLRITGNFFAGSEPGSERGIFLINGSLELGGSSRIEADVYASGNITGKDRIGGNAYPFYPAVPSFPVIDEGYYESKARENGQYYPGNADFGGKKHGHHGGEIDDYDGIYFVDGMLTISGTYSGRAIIVAQNIKIDGDLLANTPNDLLTLISLGDVDIKNYEVRALVVAAGAFRAQGGAELHGGLLVQNIEVSGNVDIYCNPELAAQNPLSGLYFGSGGVKIESWKEQFPVVS